MLSFGAIYHAFVFGIFLPFAAIRARVSSKPGPALPTDRLRKRVALSLLIFGVLSLIVAWDVGIPIFVVWHPTFVDILLASGTLGLALAARWVLLAWLRKDEPKPRLRLTPETWADLPFWGVISAIAGVCEEITYRGVLFAIITYSTQSELAGAGLSALAFALAHVQQGWRAATFIFGMAIVFQLVVKATGSLYPAMAIHTLYDFAVGILIIRELERSPVLPGQPEAEEPGLAQET